MSRPFRRKAATRSSAAAKAATVQAPKVSPFRPVGTHGFAQYGGYLRTRESNASLQGATKYKTFSELIANISIVATGLRFRNRLLTKPSWHNEPADDTDAAQEVADFFSDVLDDMATPWRRVVRRVGQYEVVGFSASVWTAKRRKDGKVGLADVAARPQFTFTRWLEDDQGNMTGVVQQSPQDGRAVAIERGRLLYMVDDAFTDSPAGSGMLRHIVDAAKRLQRLEQLEGYGYETDMRGIPIMRVPLAELDADESLTEAQKSAKLQPFEDFQDGHVRGPDNGMMIDSETYRDMAGNPSNVPKYNIELASGDVSGQAPIAAAISRLTHDIARAVGAEILMLGSGGSSGNRALAEEKAALTQLGIEGALAEMAEAVRADLYLPLAALNGIDPDLIPWPYTDSLQMRDIEQVCAAVRDLATAGVTFDRGDEAIGVIMDNIGLPRLAIDDLREPALDLRPLKTQPPAPGEPAPVDNMPADARAA